jgi:hypothetical protein
MKKPIIVLDLDETTISSAHRTPRSLETGEVMLHEFFDNRYPEKIMQDTLLPLGKLWQTLKGFTIWICTSRDMSRADYTYLEKHNLCYDKIISREQLLVNPKEAEDSQYLFHGKCTRRLKVKNSLYYEPGPTYKVKRLRSLLNLKQYRNRPVFVFDDEPKIISALRKAGFTTLNAYTVNRRLTNG